MASIFSVPLPGDGGGPSTSTIDQFSGGEKTSAFLPVALRR